MAIFTKQQFENIAYSQAKSKSFSQLFNEAKVEVRSSFSTSVFLSHCHSDKGLIKEAIAFFKGMNVSVYVDWMDTTMPEKTNGTTATMIKGKIVSNDKFILLATNDAVSSKWCNWEVGIGDILKLYKDKIALLPLADNKGDWKGNEYLQVYPRIESVNKDSNSIYTNVFKLIYPDNRSVWLDDWLKK